MTTALRAVRSLLFAPCNEPRKVEKVASFGADAIILDLEDAVPNADKVRARPMVRDAVTRIRGPLVCVRVNALSTGLTAGDVDGVVADGLDAIVLPKTETPEDVLAVDALIAAAERREGLPAGGVRLLPLVETARGVLAAFPIAAASARVLTIAFGSGDFTRDLELPAIRWSLDGVELAWARAKLVVDARAAGKPRPFDGPYIAVRDTNGMAADCRVARSLGYQGKICIHPSQVAPANRAFVPDADEVAFCRKVVTAFQVAETQGSASITVDGIFVDYPVAEKAARIIALAEALEARDEAVRAAAPAGRQA